MVIFGTWNGKTLSLSSKPNSLTISLQRQTASQVYSFDGEGRLWTAMLENISYRRGLNGKTVAKWQISDNSPASAGRDRRWLSEDESARLEEHSRLIAQDLQTSLQANQISLEDPLPDAASVMLGRAVRFDQGRYQNDVQAYHQVYRPVGILPPDQYMAVVLQATEGCSFNTCTFCNFYRDRRFRIKTTDEFRHHSRSVKQFLGEGLLLRRTIFLGDANALVIPMPRLVEILNVTREEFDIERLGGIFAFLDGFSGEKKTVQDYAVLARLGLKRIYIGMESGSEELLRFLKKPGRPEDVINAVQAIKRGGISVGLIVLLGAGGHFYSPIHTRETIAALNAMPLDLDDLIYFSELIESEGMEYTRDAFRQDLRPLSAAQRIDQGNEIENGLKFSRKSGIPHISRYDIREFVY
ncbi:MAG: radical SAM protein [Anaerolineaceae bacterium]|nr:radical SAM protein [Anaerolineaceae bacterium]